MAYAVVQDLIDRFGELAMIQLTDRSTPPANAVDDGVAQTVLDQAGRMMDGYIAAKYALPLSTTSPMLVDLNCDMARYRLFTDQVPDHVKDLYENAIRVLKDISKGTVKIDGAAGVEPESRPTVIETSGSRRLLERERLRGF